VEIGRDCCHGVQPDPAGALAKQSRGRRRGRHACHRSRRRLQLHPRSAHERGASSRQADVVPRQSAVHQPSLRDVCAGVALLPPARGVGCRVFSFSTNLAPGFRPATWLGPDRWDFSDVDTLAHLVLEAKPDGYILPRIFLETPGWWLKQHPEEVQVLDDGRRTYPPGSDSRSGQSFSTTRSSPRRSTTLPAR